MLTLGLAATAVAGSPAAPLEVGGAVLVREAGTRLRSEPTLRSDVIAELEEGRWLELVATGEVATIAGLEALWLHVRDPWAPMGDGLLAGPWEGWVWGGLIEPAPSAVPEVTHALWDRVFALSGGGPGLLMWALRPATDDPGALELGEWHASTQAPTRIRRLHGWQAVDSIHRREPGTDRIWLWLSGRGDDGRGRGQLVPTDSDAAPLDVVLRSELAEGQRLRGSLFLIDLEGDGRDEAVVQWVRTDRSGVVLERHFAPFILEADGTSRPGPGGQVREALLPPPDLQVRGVELLRRSGEPVVVVTVANAGARSEPTRLDVAITPRGDDLETLHRAAVRGLAPGEELEIELTVALTRDRGAAVLVDALVVPAGVELDLGNNRLARWTAAR